MTPFERCQSLIELQNGRLERFDRTRTIQWNFNAIFWTGIIVTVSFLIPKKTELEFTWYGLIGFDLVLLVIHFFVLKMIQSSLDYDKGKVAEYTLITERELGLNNLTDDEIRTKMQESIAGQIGKSRQWLLAQLGISIVLLIVATIIVISLYLVTPSKTTANKVYKTCRHG